MLRILLYPLRAIGKMLMWCLRDLEREPVRFLIKFAAVAVLLVIAVVLLGSMVAGAIDSFMRWNYDIAATCGMAVAMYFLAHLAPESSRRNTILAGAGLLCGAAAVYGGWSLVGIWNAIHRAMATSGYGFWQSIRAENLQNPGFTFGVWLAVAGVFASAATAMTSIFGKEGLSLSFSAKKNQPKLADADQAVHGNAQLAGEDRLAELAANKTGLIIGQRGPEKNSQLLRFALKAHAMIFGTSGSGKGNLLTCTILSWDGSMIIVDPKLASAMICAPYLLKKGMKVAILDPTGIIANKAVDVPECGHLQHLVVSNFNALDLVGLDEDSVYILKALVGALIPEAAGNSDAGVYYSFNARDIVTTVATLVCWLAPPELRNFCYVAELIGKLGKNGLAKLVADHGDIGWGLLGERTASEIRGIDEKTWAPLLATVKQGMAWMRTPQAVRQLTRSDFDAWDLVKGNLAVFLGVPQTMTDEFAPWYRMWATIPMIIAERRLPEKRVLNMVDEAALIGKIDMIVKSYLLMRGLNVSCVLISQEEHKLADEYGKADVASMMANSDAVLFLDTALTDKEGAENRSAMIGDTTYKVKTKSDQKSDSRHFAHIVGTVTDGETENEQLVAGRVMKPAQLTALPAGEMMAALKFSSGPKPFLKCYIARYQERDEFRHIASDDPYWVITQREARGKK